MAPRKVSSSGVIKWKDHQLLISTALKGWHVGLQQTETQLIEVWFSRLLLGWIDPQTINFLRSDIATRETGKTKQKV